MKNRHYIASYRSRLTNQASRPAHSGGILRIVQTLLFVRAASLCTVLLVSLMTVGACRSSKPKAVAPQSVSQQSLRGTYLELDPPGSTPRPFVPAVMANVERGVCSGFLQAGRVFVFKLLSPDLDWKFEPVYVTEFKNGEWTTPVVAPFSDLYPYNFTVAPDGKTLYFTSMRSAADHNTILSQANIWRVKKTADGWSEPETFGAPVNTEDNFENYPSVTAGGTLYYMSFRDDGMGEDDIYRLELVNGKYVKQENLGQPINTAYPEVDPFVSADESYIIYCSNRPGGFGGYDLYISFQKPDGQWAEPVNMGNEINTAGAEFRPSVTPDGKYFFFTSDQSGVGEIYWMDAGFLQTLRP